MIMRVRSRVIKMQHRKRTRAHPGKLLVRTWSRGPMLPGNHPCCRIGCMVGSFQIAHEVESTSLT